MNHYADENLAFIASFDNEVGAAMNEELKRQRRNLELIASENLVSPAVMAAMGSVLTNKYAEGYPGKRYYGGCQCVDVVEEIARQRACKLRSTPMYSLIPALKRTSRFILRCLTRGIPSWA